MAKSTEPQPIVIENVNLGGISDSLYMGMKNALASIVGFDLHSFPGVMLVNQKMTQEANAPTDDLYNIVACSDGNIYFFGKTLGNVWKSNNSGTYTQLGTVSPSTGNPGVLSAEEFNGFLYYAMNSNLGRWDFTTVFSGRSDNYATFTNQPQTYRPMLFLPNSACLYIGDGSIIADVDISNSFHANVFSNLPANFNVKSLGMSGSTLLIGTGMRAAADANPIYPMCFVVQWNTYSPNANQFYPVNEPIINSFFNCEDEVIINAGYSGNLYSLIYGTFKRRKEIPPIFPTPYSSTQKALVNYPAVANKLGIPLFGMSNSLNNPCLQGIYSYGQKTPSYPKILALEYIPSTGNLANLDIWSLETAGNNTDVYMSYSDSTSGTTKYYIDRLDPSNKATTAYFETMVMQISKVFLDIYDKFVINFAQSMPANTSIDAYYSINGGSYVEWNYGTDSLLDIIRNAVVTDRRIDARTLQIKVVVNSYQNTAPIIENMVIIPK